MATSATESLGLIAVGDGVYCKVNKVLVDCDIVDEQGNALECNGIKQSPHSQVELNGSDLVGLELPIQNVTDKILKN